MRNDASDLRKQRIQTMNRMIVQCFKDGKKMKELKFLAWVQFNIGLSKAKAREYLQVLIDMDLCTIENGLIIEVKE